MYDFHKVKQDNNTTCFAHPLFRRGAKHLISSLKRKISAQKEAGSEEKEEAGELQETMEKLQERLTRLEKQDRNREWLEGECKKLRYFFLANF